MTTTQNIKCPKCSGQGKILGFSHRDNGRCYQCLGAGTLNARTGGSYMRARLASAGAHVAAMLEAGRFDLAETAAERAAREMHAAGTATARQALNIIARGMFESFDGTRDLVRPDIGRKAAELIIAKGREQAA